MAATIINFDTGVKEFDINGAYTARFNPTDELFIAKIERTINELESLEDELKKIDKFEKFSELDKNMRGKIDELLGDGASSALFPGVNCYALSGGLPIWLNLIYAIMDVVHEAATDEFNKTDERMKRINAKYADMMKKYRKA